jgi:hypothetical protein
MPPMRSLGIYAACLFTCSVVFGSILRCLNKVGGRPDAFMHCLLGGILGSSTLVASKLMFAALVSEDRTIVRVALSAVPLITLAPFHLKVINRGFGRHPLMFMSPGLSTCGMLSNVATGCLLYNEVPVEPLYFAGGVAALCYGVASLRVLDTDGEQCGSVPIEENVAVEAEEKSAAMGVEALPIGASAP